jgi:hypothetical protein
MKHLVIKLILLPARLQEDLTAAFSLIMIAAVAGAMAQGNKEFVFYIVRPH